MRRGNPPKHDYSSLAFKVIERPEPLHAIMAAFKALTPRQMLVIQLNGTGKPTREGLRNNFYVANGGKGVRTEVEDGIMRVWREVAQRNGNSHGREEKRRKVRA